MPKRAKEMSQLEFRRLKRPETGSRMFAVGGVSGLHLNLTATGARSWILRTMVTGKRKDIGIGSAHEVGLGQARDRARAVKDQIWRGEDPVRSRKALEAAEARNLTFSEAVKKYLDSKLSEFKNLKHRQQWENTLATYATPIIGELSISEIKIDDVLRVLKPIWETKTETASRLRGRIEAVIAWATAHGHRQGDNPARWRNNLEATLPKPSKLAKVRHQPAVKVAEMAEFWALLSKRHSIGDEALKFLTLTACRVGKVRGARWAEIDTNARLWKIPAERMKADREHRVPLSPAALALLSGLPRRTEFVFPGMRKPQLSENTPGKAIKAVHAARGGEGFTDPDSGALAVPHGLRSSFRNWCADCGIERELAEMCLAHIVGSKVEQAYFRSDVIERRRPIMGSWAAFLRGEKGDNVVTIHG